MKKLKTILVLSIAVVLSVSLFGCGKEDDSSKDVEQIADLNAYTASFDDVVNLMKTEGVVSDTENAVDMNTVAGYWFDNSTNAVSTEKIAASDIAKDFNGVYLMWFDISGEHVLDWVDMKRNEGVLLYEGGKASLQLDSYKGMFALGFGANVSEDIKTKAKSAFDKLDTTAPEDVKYMTATDELAMLLKNKGYLNAADLASENLNAKYFTEGPGEEWDEETQDYVKVDNYKYYAVFGSEAKMYGKISVFYFNTLDTYAFSDENIDLYGEGLAYKSLKANNAVTGYVGNMEQIYKQYTENGKEISYSVDVVCGRFAVAVDDSVSNKAEIIDYLKTLEK